ncbi:hypothetical protein ACT4R9_05955 [Ornithobacterium rhinotracheale]|uniref:hypothetical protein n=1 Tax=Ornithobacterium rhinotracheale TaxID=28251 RepID=UPI003FA42003
MKEILQNFFKKNSISENWQSLDDITPKSIKITYEEWGFNQAEHLNGHLFSFKGSMSLVKENYLKEASADEVKRREDIENAQKQLDLLHADEECKEISIDSFNIKIENLKDKITELKNDIIRIKENPESIMKDKTSKAGFFLGLFILSFLTIYLFVFYSSASYSGFFRDFVKDSVEGVTGAIFYPQAISKAWNDGVTELVLILTIPFVFLGLGYLIHKFQEGKGVVKYFKIAFMILITFGFDAILAYKIEKGLYMVEVEDAKPEILPPHNFRMTLTDDNFWLVIFAGFIVYIIWGFIFDFVMDAYDKLDVVKQAIKAKEAEIAICESNIENDRQEIEKLKAEIAEIKKQCVPHNSILSGKTTIIDWSEFEKLLLEFTTGWVKWMSKSGIPSDIRDQVWVAKDEFIIEHQKQKNNLI